MSREEIEQQLWERNASHHEGKAIRFLRRGLHKEAVKQYVDAAQWRVRSKQISEAAEDYNRAADAVAAAPYEFKNSTNLIQEYRQKAEQAKKGGGLEGRTAKVTAAIGLFGAILFLSGNITGNVIGNISQFSANWIGIILFLVGLIGCFYWFRNK